MSFKFILPSCVIALLATAAFAEVTPMPGTRLNARYATDAFPGFDNVDAITKPEKKTPRWFAFWTGPKKDNAADQFAWCEQLELEGARSSAAKQYDALVRNFPTAPEAPKAQQRLAELRVAEEDWIEAFEEYRYLLDFYAAAVDYPAIIARLYALAGRMREEGKTIIFFRFDNTVDVRRAYESVVLRAPGESFIPAAMLTIGELRVEEGKAAEAIAVYENLRNRHYGTPESDEALRREAALRMRLLKDYGYNAARVQDTIDFLDMAIRAGLSVTDSETFRAYRDEALAWRADEAWRSVRFYDSRTRTRRSAITEYENFIRKYPDNPHAEEARERLAVLKGASEKEPNHE